MLFILLTTVPVLLVGGTLTGSFYFKPPIGAVTLILDPLAAFFVALTAVMSFWGIVYASGYLRHYHEREIYPLGSHYFLMCLLIVAMLLVPVVQNALAFLVIWEIMSLASFFLVLFEHDKSEVMEASLNYLVAMHVGVAFLLLGFISLAVKSQSFDFASFPIIIRGRDSFSGGWILASLLVGFGLKAGFVPLHTWLPKAHPAAPSPISALMSGVMIKTGIYGILRTLTFIDHPTLTLGYTILGLSLVSGLMGIIYAVAQNDLKRLLAYSSIENIGIIGIGIGLGVLGQAYHIPAVAAFGFAGALLHVLNHSIFKGLLFYGAGLVYQKTHTRDMEMLGGLIKKMPATAFCFLVASLAICGLPLFNGFISEFLIYSGFLNGLNWKLPFFSVACVLSTAALALIGAVALLCFTKVYSIVFLGSPRSELAKTPSGVEPKSMTIPMMILTGACLGLGIFPQELILLVGQPLRSLNVPDGPSLLGGNIFVTLNQISSGLLLFIAVTGIIYFLRRQLLKNRTVPAFRTWDCGYPVPTPRMQYSAASYSASFLSLAEFLIQRQTQKDPPEGLFPQKAQYRSHSKDIFEAYVLHPLLVAFKKFMDLFAGIQSGSIQQYILYGLVFLTGILLWIATVK